MKALNVTKGTWLASDLEVADSFLKRLRGLLGRIHLPDSRGLWITPCDSIHTIGMLFPIDVVFLNREGRVVKAIHNLAPFRLVLTVKTASSVIELPAGTLRQTHTEEGDVVRVIR